MRTCKILLTIGLISGLCFIISKPAYAADTNNSSATNSTFTYPFTMGKITYDPLKCSTDPKGMVYFAIGHKVLRQPAKNINYIFVIFSSTDKGIYINPPNPSEPIGCHDNPIQGFSFSLVPLSNISEDHRNILSKYVDIIGLNIGKNPRTQYDNLFSDTCNSNSFRDTGIPGFIGCRKHFVECYQNLAYQALDHYTADGKKLIVWCPPDTNCPDKAEECLLDYKISDGLSLKYGFRRSKMPIQEVINYDLEVKQRLEAAEVKNYPWPDTQQTTNPKQ